MELDSSGSEEEAVDIKSKNKIIQNRNVLTQDLNAIGSSNEELMK